MRVETPPWLEMLPREGRGFPVPAESPWDDGVPRLSLIASDRKVALAFARGCAVCGCEMLVGEPVYRAFAQGDAATIRMHENDHSHDYGGPSHLSCMLYSAIVCPYLREPTARLGKASMINPGARRGGLAAIMGFRDATLMLYSQAHEFLAGPEPYFGYVELVEDIRFRQSSELRERYESAVARDAALIDTNSRAYWTDSESDIKNLSEVLRRSHAALASRDFDYRVDLMGTPYVAFSLPLREPSRGLVPNGAAGGAGSVDR